MAQYEPGDTPCALCARAVDEEFPFATSDGEFEHADSVMHWDCYARWPERRAWAAAYVAEMRNRHNPYWVEVLADAHAVVLVNPDPGNERVQVLLVATATELEVLPGDWAAWLKGQTGPRGVHPVEAAALEAARPGLAQALPDAKALLAAATRVREM